MRLEIEIKKCGYVIFNNLRTNPENLELLMNEQEINRIKLTTFLGIALDERLKFIKFMRT